MAEQTTPGDLMGLMLRRWWVLALGILLGAGLAVGALRVLPATYTATATQLIKGVPGSGTGAPYLAAQFAVARAKSYPAFIFSSTVLDSVRSDLGPAFTDARLRDQLSAGNPTDTPLVQVTATGSTAKEAQDLANSASRHLARFITQIETVSGNTPVIVETAVQAGLPAAPSSPQPTLILALGLTGGFALGVIGVLVWGAVSARPRRPRRAQSDDDSLESDDPSDDVTSGSGSTDRSADAVASDQPERVLSGSETLADDSESNDGELKAPGADPADTAAVAPTAASDSANGVVAARSDGSHDQAEEGRTAALDDSDEALAGDSTAAGRS